jgi:D-alanyl-D-alanine carboxypeptidase (penicillin-binding protein 5/6)
LWLLSAVIVAVAVGFPIVAAPVGATPMGAGWARLAAPVTTTPSTTAPPLPPPKAWIVVDVDSGNVIDAGNDRVPLPPASLTKVITALAARDLPPDAPISISDRAAAAPADKLMLKSGAVWTADQMVRALLLSSANDAAVALAERLGGTLEGFQPIVARTAMALGMSDNPVLQDPAGLDGPDGVDGGNLVSARDLAIAGRALLAVPSLASIVATPVYYFDGPDNVHHRLTNHNKLFLTTYAGAIGVKTGYTKHAGACLMAAARVGGRTMLAVVLRSSNPTAQAKLLLDKGFATPLSAEGSVDRLPAVNLAALDPAATAAPVRSEPAPPPAAASVTAPSAVIGAHVTGKTFWPLAAVGGLALLLCLAAVATPRTRRRRHSVHSVHSVHSRPTRRTRRRQAA